MSQNQKRNKIIVLIALIGVIGLISYLAIFKHNFKIIPKGPTGQIKGVVIGPSVDAQIIGNIGLSNIKLLLIDADYPQNVFQTISNNLGSFTFSNIPSGKYYWLRIDDSQFPGSYYLPAIEKITFPYAQKSVSYDIHLMMNEKALRDHQRQQSLYLYRSLLEDYKKDHGSYPIILGDKPTIKVNSLFISLFSPYLKKKNMDAKNLLDPLSGRYFIYRSDGKGEHYWLLAYPEIVFNVPLFDKKENAYLIHQ